MTDVQSTSTASPRLNIRKRIGLCFRLVLFGELFLLIIIYWVLTGNITLVTYLFAISFAFVFLRFILMDQRKHKHNSRAEHNLSSSGIVWLKSGQKILDVKWNEIEKAGFRPKQFVFQWKGERLRRDYETWKEWRTEKAVIEKYLAHTLPVYRNRFVMVGGLMAQVILIGLNTVILLGSFVLGYFLLSFAWKHGWIYAVCTLFLLACLTIGTMLIIALIHARINLHWIYRLHNITDPE